MLKKIGKIRFTQIQLQLIFFILFICIGSIYANLTASRHQDDYKMIFDFFGNRIHDEVIIKTDLFQFLLLSRFKLLIGLWIAGFILFVFYIDLGILSFFGFNFGLIMSSALIYNGFKSYVLILALCLPHGLLYVPICCYLVIKNISFSKALYRNRKITKSFKINGQLLLEYFLVGVICGVFMLIGVTLEAYVNPDLIKWAISMLSL
ncbi:MAG: stage II sporulation protein M [Vallitaleaceae bacterium]|nr:stage II sporulation protein M [Vallitaleaceae bacterium]